ncbi:hypothetical protein HYW59_04865 [Candidatus Kaiserbacteria bacterium]|nr:hypothetical protein [Candidatus Kaiserbacteria bacterium]
MPKPTALIKCSSRLLGRDDVTARVHEIEKTYALRFVTGGGEQISAAFAERGWENVFGPFGRICKDFDQRLAAENVLKKNVVEFEDQLEASRIFATMVVPVLDKEIGGVTCHVNGDFHPINGYNGYARIFVFTFDDDVARKRWFYRAMWQVCRIHLEQRSMQETITFNPDDYPEKIEVVGFPESSP